MFEYMDGIVNAVEEFGQEAVDIAVYMLLPYKMWRKGRKE